MPRGKAFKTKGDEPTAKVTCPAWVVPYVQRLIWAIDQSAAPEALAKVLVAAAEALTGYAAGTGDRAKDRDAKGDD